MERSHYSEGDISEVIGMAWADDVPFEDIRKKMGLSESDVITIMRSHLKPSSFRLWRKRVSGRKTKHRKLLQNQIEYDGLDTSEG